MMPRSVTALALVAGLLAGACSDFATEPTRTPSELRVTPDTLHLLTGETAEFQVELLDESGTPYEVIPSWAPPLWTSEKPERVEFQDGLVVPTGGGENELTVELAGLQAQAVVVANPAELGMVVGMAYINQGVQRTRGDIPLVAGRDGLLRVMLIGDDVNYYRPGVNATFYNDGAVVHSVTLEVEADGIPTAVEEGFLALSHDALIPGSVIQPGVGLVLELDPTSVVPAAPGTELRVPATGTLELDVREVPPFRLMMVPVTLAGNGGRTSRLEGDLEFAEQQARLIREIFPLADFQVQVRAPYTTESLMDTEGGWYSLIQEIRALRLDDGNVDYYYGGFDRPPGTGIGGLGYVGYPVSIGMDNREDVIAHEVGHNFSLPHAPCGGPANPDPGYPHLGGVTGAYGFQVRTGYLKEPDLYDLMTYCDPIWISDYNFEKVMDYRETSEFDPYLAAGAGTGAALTAGEAGGEATGEPTVLIQGGVLNGALQLGPALEWTGPVSLPEQTGRYTLEGLDVSGGVVFSVSLEPLALDHGDASQFQVSLPASMVRTDILSRLRLRGPEGVVERGRRSGGLQPVPTVRMDRAAGASGAAAARWDVAAFPLAVVRDRQTGRIRAMSQTGRVTIPDGDAVRYEVVLSDGVGTRPARVVQR